MKDKKPSVNVEYQAAEVLIQRQPEELPEAINLLELNLSDDATKKRITELFPTLDKYTRDVLWHTWRDNAGHVCTKCGYIVAADSGICGANPEHKFRSYVNGYKPETLIFH